MMIRNRLVRAVGSMKSLSLCLNPSRHHVMTKGNIRNLFGQTFEVRDPVPLVEIIKILRKKCVYLTFQCFLCFVN
jgi:hypothetical protein